jgi:ubiquinone/menaquinone biosynthesis C-methylase UbiE
VNATRPKRFKVIPEMEGIVARWYARQRGSASQLQAYPKQAAQLTEGLAPGADVLEVAPGPGYLAVEMARLGFHVTGLDISRSFVEIARRNARQAAVSVDFRQGDAASLPFAAESFDLVVCQAAFKNFTQPASALDEMYRVLRRGGTAVIHDLRRDASGADIDREVDEMGLSRPSALGTRWTLRMLRRRAYSPVQFEHLAAQCAFRTCDIQIQGIGMRCPRGWPTAARPG